MAEQRNLNKPAPGIVLSEAGGVPPEDPLRKRGLVWGKSSIRTRLVVSSIVLVLVILVAFGSVSAVFGWQLGRARIDEKLEFEVRLKELEIEAWIANLENNLGVAASDQTTLDVAEFLLRRYAEFSNDEDLTPQNIPLDLRTSLRSRLQLHLNRTQLFHRIAVVDAKGRVVVATEPLPSDLLPSLLPSFGQEPASFTVNLFFANEPWVVVSMPLFDSALNPDTDAPVLRGYIVGCVDLAVVNEMMSDKSGLGTTGDIYLVGSNSRAITQLRFGEQNRLLRNDIVTQALATHVNGKGIYRNARNVLFVTAYHWLPRLNCVLLAEQQRSEAFQVLYVASISQVVVLLIALLVAVVASLYITRSIVRPLASLSETARQIAAGQLDQMVRVDSQDEIGRLAQVFNVMTEQLRELFSNQEQRVMERTSDLERRSTYLETSAEIARAASSILDVEDLIRQAVELIRVRFSLYYVGLFLVEGDWAVLSAGTGDAGQAMLARNHRIQIGEGMIGWCVANAQPRLASRAETDAVRVTNPELPDTRSELALPLHSRGQVLGALSVQSNELDAFDEVAITTLQIMADQVAVAVDNAKLFAASQEALELERRVYGERSRQSWADLLRTRKSWGYVYEHPLREDEATMPKLIEAQGKWSPEMREAKRSGYRVQSTLPNNTRRLVLPVWVGSDVIGVLSFDRVGADVDWADEEIMLLEALIDQLAQTLERAQLYWNTQRRAAREQLTREITDAMRRTLNWDELMQVAIQEMGTALEASHAFVQWTPSGMVAPGTQSLRSVEDQE